jgi:hypothetical protein
LSFRAGIKNAIDNVNRMAYTGRGGEQLADYCRVEKFGVYSAIQPRSSAELAARPRDDTAAATWATP